MPSARIFSSIDQSIPDDANTLVSFNSTLWDDGGFYNPAQPTRLTAPLNGRYSIGCCLRLITTLASAFRAQLRRGGSDVILQHTHHHPGFGFDTYTISMHTEQRLLAGHYIEVLAYHSAGIARFIDAQPHFSPHFWIAYLGPYPA